MRKTHCKQGHDVSVKGRYVSGNCVQCTLDREAKRRADDPAATRVRRTAEYKIRKATHAERHAESSRKAARKKNGIVNPTGETKSGPCDMCGVPKPRLCMDHCHITGKIRGWLCWPCNIGLGYYEKPGWLQIADTYLRAKGHL